MLELNCHGNPVIVDALMTHLITLGCKPAEPGEFTLRSLSQGKMSLLQAEVVGALAEIKTQEQLDFLQRHREGTVRHAMDAFQHRILSLQASIEAVIDYPEEGVETQDVQRELQHLIRDLSLTIKDSAKVVGFLKGYEVAILGPPNAGKSTLLNALTGKSCSIVSQIPGTTRDIVTHWVNWQGLPIHLWDTAGLRETQDQIEQLGIKQLEDRLKEADLLLWCQAPESPEPPPCWLDKPLLVVQTKGDLIEESQPSQGSEACFISAKAGWGLDPLKKTIVEKLTGSALQNPASLITQRQLAIAEKAKASLDQLYQESLQGHGDDMISLGLTQVRRQLGEITGETTVDDLLETMFSRFCLGK
jgi:tRNA modification GTPase